MVSEAQKRATAKYEKENYDKILVRFPKGTKKRILESGADSVNGYIINCVLNALDSSQNADKTVLNADTDKIPKQAETTVKTSETPYNPIMDVKIDADGAITSSSLAGFLAAKKVQINRE